MKIKILILIMLSSFTVSRGANDTTIVYKILPPLFKDIFSSNENSYFSRDQVLNLYKNDVERLTLITNYFSLEDEYIRLNTETYDKSFFYIYTNRIFFYPEEMNSYLDVGDTISLSCPRNLDEKAIVQLIQSGILTQHKFIPKFNLKFIKPKLLEFYYKDHLKPLTEVENYKITLKDYRELYRSQTPKIVNIDKPRIVTVENTHTDFEKYDDSLVKSIIIAQPDTLPPFIGKEWGDPLGTGAGALIVDEVTDRMFAKMSKKLLDTLAENMEELIGTYRYFLKYNLPKNVMFRTLPNSDTLFDKTQNFIRFSHLSGKARKKHKEYIKFDINCRILKACIYNAYTDSLNKRKYKYVSGAQEGYGKLFQAVDDIEIIYIKQSFLKTTPWKLTFRELIPFNSLGLDTIRNAVLGYRESISDQLNSLNYLDPEFKKVTIPPLLRKLGTKVLSDLVTLVKDKTNQDLTDVKISYRFFEPDKLWVKTDTKEKTVYISPYLIRAAFTKSLENLALFEIANQQLNLKSFFKAKGQYISYISLNNVYGRKAFEDYENTLRFILSHELAHIYLKSKETSKMEQLCDCYGLALLKASSSSNLGVFETLLIKSIEEGATRFWKAGLEKDELLERFNFLKKYKVPNQNLDSNLCDSLFIK